jgi:hypothetical protein
MQALEAIPQLSRKIYNTLTELAETKRYCVVDRTASKDYHNVLKDTFGTYSSNAICIERLFKKDSCEIVNVPMYEISDEARVLYEEFTEFMNTADSVKDVEKINEYSIRLQDMPPKVVDKPMYVYKGLYGNPDFRNLVPLEEIPADALMVVSDIIASHAFYTFNTMYLFLSNINYEIDMINTGDIYEDYADVLIQIGDIKEKKDEGDKGSESSNGDVGEASENNDAGDGSDVEITDGAGSGAGEVVLGTEQGHNS